MDTVIRSAENQTSSDIGYEADFHAWILAQAALLRAGRLAELDTENLAEEIESLAGRERRELRSRLEVLLLHLLKWAYQPDLRGRSWQSSVLVQRLAIASHLRDNPSLRATIDETVAKAYLSATFRAELETGFPQDHFAWACPFTFEQMMDRDFWPEQMP